MTSGNKNMEKRTLAYTVGPRVNWCSLYENSIKILQKLKKELPYDPAMPFLGVWPKNEIRIPNDICTLSSL